jgi:hypothetical protein
MPSRTPPARWRRGDARRRDRRGRHLRGDDAGHQRLDARQTADEWAARLAPQWPTNRQPAVDRAILRLAIWELTNTDTPPKVVIDEAIELAKHFSTATRPPSSTACSTRCGKEVVDLKGVPSSECRMPSEGVAFGFLLTRHSALVTRHLNGLLPQDPRQAQDRPQEDVDVLNTDVRTLFIPAGRSMMRSSMSCWPASSRRTWALPTPSASLARSATLAAGQDQERRPGGGDRPPGNGPRLGDPATRELTFAETGTTVIMGVRRERRGEDDVDREARPPAEERGEEVVMVCASDTFRAAAVDQLTIWAQRIGVEIVKHKTGADPAAVAYDAARRPRRAASTS